MVHQLLSTKLFQIYNLKLYKPFVQYSVKNVSILTSVFLWKSNSFASLGQHFKMEEPTKKMSKKTPIKRKTNRKEQPEEELSSQEGPLQKSCKSQTAKPSAVKTRRKVSKKEPMKFVFKFQPPVQENLDSKSGPVSSDIAKPYARKTIVPKEILEKVTQDKRSNFAESSLLMNHGDIKVQHSRLNKGEGTDMKLVEWHVDDTKEKLENTKLSDTDVNVMDTASTLDDALEMDTEALDLLKELPLVDVDDIRESLDICEDQKGTKKKRKTKKKVKKGEGHDEEKKQPRKMPNYFISLPVTNVKIQSTVDLVQQTIVSSVPEVEKACIQAGKRHLTLMVMHLEEQDQEQVNRGELALHECLSEIEDLVTPPLVLNVHGISHFNHAVIYADIQEDEQANRLTQIVDKVRGTFAKHGIDDMDQGFTPHITILKLSKLRRKKGCIKKVPSASYKELVDVEFGQQMAECLQLCAMLKKQQPDKGGYHVQAQLDLVPEELKHSSDTEESSSDMVKHIVKSDTEEKSIRENIKEQDKSIEKYDDNNPDSEMFVTDSGVSDIVDHSEDAAGKSE